ncbi:MAG: hypothetical protein WD595_02380 [Waddliaceae bacterium]
MLGEFDKRSDAIFDEEIKAFADSHSLFRYFPQSSRENTRLSVKKIINTLVYVVKKIVMCGPAKLTYESTNQFQLFGVKRGNIIYEDFEFF